MSKKKTDQPRGTATRYPGCSEVGQAVDPNAAGTDSDAEGAGGAMPLGLPIPLEQYEALQKDLKRRKADQPGIAQEDSAKSGET